MEFFAKDENGVETWAQHSTGVTLADGKKRHIGTFIDSLGNFKRGRSGQPNTVDYTVDRTVDGRQQKHTFTLTVEEKSLKAWQANFERIVRDWAGRVLQQIERYFPEDGEHTWWSVLTPAGIPNVNDPAQFATMQCDAKIAKLAAHFGATDKFRRLTPQEAENKGPGDTVNGKNRPAHTLARF